MNNPALIELSKPLPQSKGFPPKIRGTPWETPLDWERHPLYHLSFKGNPWFENAFFQ